MIFQFLLYRGKKCIYEENFAEVRQRQDPVADQKLLVGMLIAMKSFAQQVSPTDPSGFNSFATPHYRLHYLETATGYRFILTTDPRLRDLREHLMRIYRDIFAVYVLENPVYHSGMENIAFPLFVHHLRQFVSGIVLPAPS